MPGTIIKNFREQRKLTQDYVANLMDISQNAYSKIENNYTQLTVAHLKALSKILEVGILELLRDDFEIHKPIDLQRESITKENLVMTIENIKEKIENKSPQKHDFYPVIMSMFQSIDGTLHNVH